MAANADLLKIHVIIGNEQKINDVSEVFVYIDEQPVGNLEMFESEDGIFEIPAGFIKHDFKIQVKDEKEFETNELYISVEEEK